MFCAKAVRSFCQSYSSIVISAAKSGISSGIGSVQAGVSRGSFLDWLVEEALSNRCLKGRAKVLWSSVAKVILWLI